MLCKRPYMCGIIPCPCGDCLPCKINKRRVLTTRLMIEQLQHSRSCFVTLTYDDEHLPENFSLRPRDPKLFLGRIRKALPVGSVRAFYVGEYGDKGERPINPHYHMALFGYSCEGRISEPATGRRCFCSFCEFLRSKWKCGNVDVEELNRKTAQYICGYTIKKMTSKDDSRLAGRHPEFARYPTRPGLGGHAISTICDSLTLPNGAVLLTEQGDIPATLYLDGKKLPIGRYLKNKLREEVNLDSEILKMAYAEEMRNVYYSQKASPKDTSLSIKEALVAHFKGQSDLAAARFNLYQQTGVL